MRIESPKGPEGFDRFYFDHLGSRWASLREALEKPVHKIEMINPFASSVNGLSRSYAFDPASQMAIENLDVEVEQNILDMCSAPGGKALNMIFRLRGEARFVLNDLSHQRLNRLRRVLREHVPEDIRMGLRVTRFDASRWGLREPESYDRVLLDAPCSGERHLLSSQIEMNHWSMKRSMGLVRRQYTLLCAGIQALKPGGKLLYSTCSLNPMENDKVIHRYLENKGGVEVLDVSAPVGEATDFGHQVLPDTSPGMGPMYFCLLQKSHG